jgi:hypothetical protein
MILPLGHVLQLKSNNSQVRQDELQMLHTTASSDIS